MEELRLKLIEDLNNSKLPVEALMFVVRDVYRDVTEAYNKFLAQQKQELKKVEGEVVE